MCWICRIRPKPKKHDLNADPQTWRRVVRLDKVRNRKGRAYVRLELDCGCVFHFPASFVD